MPRLLSDVDPEKRFRPGLLVFDATGFEGLDDISQRIELLRRADNEEICYSRTVELALATEDVVISEIENWQAVFRGKQITVPV